MKNTRTMRRKARERRDRKRYEEAVKRSPGWLKPLMPSDFHEALNLTELFKDIKDEPKLN